MKGVYLVLYMDLDNMALALERLSGTAKYELNSLPQAGQKAMHGRSSSFLASLRGSQKR
jgi:hypothetical protein